MVFLLLLLSTVAGEVVRVYVCVCGDKVRVCAEEEERENNE